MDQWLILRGQDVNKPVLLFLSGGPGASEAGRVLRFNQELEKHFVVAIWEQRGCGKSYPSLNPKSDLTVEQYVSDIIELTDLLRARFDEQKIYLVGHSWGSIIGVRAVQERPDLFHAYIGTAQMVDVSETDQMIYEMVMEHSQKTGDTQFVETLEKQGPPPYFGKSPIKPYATLFGREYAIFEVPNIKDPEYRADGDAMMLMLKQPEYGWLDRVYYLLGLMNTFNVVYPQLQEMDFRQDATHFDLPVYLILGRHDMNNPSQIPEEYFNLIQAPSKQLYLLRRFRPRHDLGRSRSIPRYPDQHRAARNLQQISNSRRLINSSLRNISKGTVMKRKFTIILFVLTGLSLAAVSFFSIRQSIAKLAIEREWRSGPPPAYNLATTSKLEIIPLYEEASLSDSFISGHGVSYLIRTDSATILLDVGNNPDDLSVAPFMQNMQKLGIDWDEIDRIVISHPHPDHIGGVKAWWDHTVSMGALELPGDLGDRLIFVPSPCNV